MLLSLSDRSTLDCTRVTFAVQLLPRGLFALTGETHQDSILLASSQVDSEIGKAAGVKFRSKLKSKLDSKSGERRPVEVVKFASAHDLRRSFGERWAERVLPKVLMELMRHESIGTTMRFYVGQNAQRTADAAWAAYEAVLSRQQAEEKARVVNTSVNSQAPAVPAAESENDTSPCITRACENWGIGI